MFEKNKNKQKDAGDDPLKISLSFSSTFLHFLFCKMSSKFVTLKVCDEQCDQIGRFFNVLDDKYSIKRAQIFCDLLGKNFCGNFWATVSINWATL